MEFTEFPKMPRWSREVVVTEKIDGTNAQILIQPLGDAMIPPDCACVQIDGEMVVVRAGSRNRWVSPDDDNYGFAAWVHDHAAELASGLGDGRHFGEWWGQGIQRRYNQDRKRFSLFNTGRWCSHGAGSAFEGQAQVPACCDVVPTIWRGLMDDLHVGDVIHDLECDGSLAAPGFMDPEGIIIFHVAANMGFKKTIKRDEVPKSKA